jgi:hypothetical protein
MAVREQRFPALMRVSTEERSQVPLPQIEVKLTSASNAS